MLCAACPRTFQLLDQLSQLERMATSIDEAATLHELRVHLEINSQREAALSVNTSWFAAKVSNTCALFKACVPTLPTPPVSIIALEQCT